MGDATWATLGLPLVAALAATAIYAGLALALGRRPVGSPHNAALQLFRLFWIALAITALLRPVQVAMARGGMLPVWLYQTLQQVTILVACTALWALLCYLTYVHQGTRRWWVPLGAAYALYATFLLAVVAWSRPQRLVELYGQVRPDPQPILPDALNLAIFVTLAGPQIAAAVAYLRLYAKAPDATARYRIALVGSSILVWFSALLVGGALRIRSVWWPAASQTVGLAAALVVWLAYYPPAPWRRKWGLRSLGREA